MTTTWLCSVIFYEKGLFVSGMETLLIIVVNPRRSVAAFLLFLMGL